MASPKFKELFDQTHEDLKAYINTFVELADKRSPFDVIFDALKQDPRSSGEAFEILFSDGRIPEIAANLPPSNFRRLLPAFIASAYFVQCARELKLGPHGGGDLDAAWGFLAEARWWMGYTALVPDFARLHDNWEEVLAETAAKSRSQVAALAAAARHEPWGKVKDATLAKLEELYRTTTFKNKAAAARAVAPDAERFAEELGLKFTLGKPAAKRIYDDWMPSHEATERQFPRKRRPTAVILKNQRC